MREMKLTAGIAIVALLAAGAAVAEVRLVESAADGALTVEISSTPRGPWTPTGSVTDDILNPSGDLLGDGMPGWDTRGSRVLSAWIRPGSSALHRSLGTSPGWDGLPATPSPGAQGQPVVDVLDGGWGITWQSVNLSASSVLITGTTPEGVGVAPLLVSGGVLVGTTPAGNLIHVITMDNGTGQLWCTTVSFSFIPTQPIPIQLSIIGRVRLGRGGALPNFDPPVPNAGNGNGWGRRDEPFADPRVQDVLKADGSFVGLVTWWGADGELHGVEIGANGPTLPGRSMAGGKGRGHGVVGKQQLMDELLLLALTD